MNLDITGKVGIENALELLEEQVAVMRGLNSDNIMTKAYIEGLEKAIEIVKLNITNKD